MGRISTCMQGKSTELNMAWRHLHEFQKKTTTSMGDKASIPTIHTLGDSFVWSLFTWIDCVLRFRGGR